MEKFLGWFACKKKKPKAPSIQLSTERRPTIIESNLRALAPRHRRKSMKKLSKVTFSEPVNLPEKREDCDESMNEKIEVKVERRLHLTFANGTKNRWARRILRDLNAADMTTEELVNFELFIIGKLTLDAEDRFLIHGDWIKEWVNYLTLDSETIGPVNNDRLAKKILKPKDVIFTVNQHIWNFLKLHHGVGYEFPISLKIGDETKKDHELWIQTDQEVALNVFLECPPWFIAKFTDKEKGLKGFKRRDSERAYFEAHNEKESEVKYVLPEVWFNKYKNYISLTANIESPVPDNIDMTKLYKQLNDEKFSFDIPYVLVNEHIWHLVSNVYNAKHKIGVKKVNLRARSNRVIEFESWSEEIEIRRRRKNLVIGEINASKLSYDTRELLCLENLRAQTLDLDESDIIFKADEGGGFGQAVRSIKSFL